MKFIFQILQKLKQRRANRLGMPLPQGIRELQKRKYLTYGGIIKK